MGRCEALPAQACACVEDGLAKPAQINTASLLTPATRVNAPCLRTGRALSKGPVPDHRGRCFYRHLLL